MFRLVLLCLVFIILRAEANVPETVSENPEIRLSYTYNKEENYTVFKDKPLMIIIENGYARYVWCSSSIYSGRWLETFVPETEFSNDTINKLYITNVTAEMSTRWKCTVLQEYHGPVLQEHRGRNYTAKDLFFSVHVKGARAVNSIVNNQSLSYVTTNLGVNYDGEVNYTYEDDDFSINFSCEKVKDYHEKDTLRLEYYNAEGILLFKTKPRVTPHIFRTVLKSSNDKYYLDCIRTAKDPDREYLYRTTFLKKRDIHAGAVNSIVNNQSLSYVTTNLSVNYDGEANYTYEDGDFSINFSCEKGKDYRKEDTLRLEYYNAEGILLFKTKPRVTPHIFRTVLKSSNDKYYLDCIRTAKDPDREYLYRTTFLKKRDIHADAVQHAVILSVDGQILKTSFNKDKSYDDYIFRYIDGEVLNVTCRKMNVFERGTLTFNYDKAIIRHMSKILRSPLEDVISLNISTSDIKNKSLICSINNTDVEKPNARLEFLSDVPEYDVRIRGLPRNNILYQYTNNNYQWTIEYQYSVNDTLHLTCVSNGGFHVPQQQHLSSYPFEWKFEGNSNISAAIEISNTQIKFSKIPFTKILDATHNGIKIKCIYFPYGKHDLTTKIVEIILRLKPELVLEAKRNDDPPGKKSDRPQIVPIAAAVGVAIFIITIICLVLWRKRTKRVNLIENAYDNLSNQNDSPIPAFPSQWEANYDDSNYAKIDEGVMQENYNYSTENDKLYSMPYKRQSNTSENHYTEIDDYLKPKPDGLQANCNTAQPSNYNKQTDTLKVTASHGSNNASYNNLSDSKQGTYEKLRHNNLPTNNVYENYSKVQNPSKNKSVTFRQMSNDLRPGRNYSEGNSRQDGGNNDRKVKPKDAGYYANTGQDIYMQPGDMHKKPNYENHFLQNEKTNNSDYAEPYGELGISCKNDFLG